MAIRRSVVTLLVVAGCVVVGLGVAAAVLDDRSHGRPCRDLPDEGGMRVLLATNVATVPAIRNVDPDHVGFEAVEDDRCPGRFSILITYGTHGQRERIEALLRGTGLAGAPISWRNV